MALFQPTNIIPSTLIGQGTVDVNDNMEISWQVNGNSAMTAFQIEFYENNAESSRIVGTGKIPYATGQQERYGLPFYGTDRFGNPQFFTYSPNETWKAFNSQFTNGNEYKLKITQWYGSSSVVQTSLALFITRDAPTLAINQTDDSFLNPVALPSTLATSIGYFQAAYNQKQGDAIRWIRWQVAQANNGVVGEILADTGDVYTPTLDFEFNGFFNGQQYAIRCFGESESGQSCDTGWQYFSIEIDNPGKYSGNFTAKCLNKENATLLEWEPTEFISPETNPPGYIPSITNGSVALDANSSLVWSKQGANPMSFGAPWTAAIKLQWLKIPKSTVVTFTGHTVTDSTTENRTAMIPANSYVMGKGYMGKTTFSFKTGMARITDVRIIGAGISSSEYSVDEKNRTCTITVYCSTSVVVSAGISVYYEYYKLESQQQVPSKITSYSVTSASDNILSYSISYSSSTITAVIYSAGGLSLPVLTANVSYIEPPSGKLYEVQDGSGNSLTLTANSDSITADYNEDNLFVVSPQNDPDSVAVLITPAGYHVYSYYTDYTGKHSQLISGAIALQNWQFIISSVSVYGGTTGATFDSVSVYKGDGSNISSLYQNPDFEPVWNADNYSLYMTANFNGNLEGGTGTTSGNGFRVYRQEVGTTILKPIATVSATTTSLKDYGIVSRKAYQYLLYAYDINGAFMSAVEADSAIATNFKSYSLLVCDYNQTNDEYHVRKQYLFALDLTDGSVGNNNSPTLNANFTPYPTRMPSAQNYASGTLSGLIGAIYTVPALIEQIGQHKYTAKPSTLDYFDSVDLEKELYDLSVAPYQLFLRDMKGRLRMIATGGPITMTTNLKQRQQSISISLPWVEVGDASDVTIIQTPDDYGWDNDNQVLDVQLDVDVETGELSAQYPFPYSGTKFYLTGVNKETLTAKTPLGVTPAQFELSDTAAGPDDGELVAKVKVNSEDNQ